MVTVRTYTRNGKPFDPKTDRIDLDKNPHIERYLKECLAKQKKDGKAA